MDRAATVTAPTKRRGPLGFQCWHGPLCVDNVADIAERMQQMLDGQRYTFVSTAEHTLWPTAVRVGNRLAGPVKLITEHEDGQPWAYIGWRDAGWCMSISTDHQTPQDAYAEPSRRVSVSFDRDRIEIQQTSMAGERLYWVIVVEGE